MSACAFFGHRDISTEIEAPLRSTLIDLIENHDVSLFYVGNHGGFDSMVKKTLSKLSEEYNINYFVVLAYMPEKQKGEDNRDYSKTILPDGIETVPKRFAISYRNKWMIKKAEYVVTYVNHTIGSGAAQFKALAEKQGKKVIELSR